MYCILVHYLYSRYQVKQKWVEISRSGQQKSAAHHLAIYIEHTFTDHHTAKQQGALAIHLNYYSATKQKKTQIEHQLEGLLHTSQ